MTPTTLIAIFDGHHLIPEGPCDLKPSARYRLQVETELPRSEEATPWDVIECLTGSVPGPEDWASQHDHYLNRALLPRSPATPTSCQPVSAPC